MLRFFSPRRLLIAGMMSLFLLAVARGLAVQGWIRPIRVVSGSMVERLYGEHFQVTCNDCGFPFTFGVESPPPNEKVVCPNCGFAGNPLRDARRERGDRVLVDRAAFAFDSPKRFDMVAFQDPSQSGRWVVKRVVGLPGERVAIRRGDLFVGNKIVRKSLAEFRRMAQPVHSNNYRPRPQQFLPARWIPESDTSCWHSEGTDFIYNSLEKSSGAAVLAPSDEMDWLSYHHWRCFANPFPRSAEAPVSDNYGYNQGESRELQKVVDLLLTCRIVLNGPGDISFRIHNGEDWFILELDGEARSVLLFRGSTQLTRQSLPADLRLNSSPLDVEFGLVDQQLVFGLAGKELLRVEYDPIANLQFRPDPIAIGGEGDHIVVSNLRVLRDIYYLDPWSSIPVWQSAEAADEEEFFLLGDNPPISEDSRRWSKPFLPASSILGRVTRYSR